MHDFLIISFCSIIGCLSLGLYTEIKVNGPHFSIKNIREYVSYRGKIALSFILFAAIYLFIYPASQGSSSMAVLYNLIFFSIYWLSIAFASLTTLTFLIPTLFSFLKRILNKPQQATTNKPIMQQEQVQKHR